ncbi:uncharacterized protein LOC127781259 isoform X1 [Oryza glaberrima]|uniref:uncharacterized protein LOC127781259 isoform X1 n=1 Tax=Oryza glaberrima TaxID=4538 RepID=UPI00224C06EC|nr:uncharacterized protein LOC127781259 isoform X1 [Oryza glaberrima]
MEMESPWSLEAEVGHRVEDLWEVAEPQLSPSEKLNSCFEDIAVASFHRPLGSQVLMAYIIPPVLVSFARRVRPPLWFLATGTVVVLGRRLSYDWQQLQRKVGRSNLDDRSVNTTPSHNRPDLWYSHLLQNSLPGYPLHLPFYSSGHYSIWKNGNHSRCDMYDVKPKFVSIGSVGSAFSGTRVIIDKYDNSLLFFICLRKIVKGS